MSAVFREARDAELGRLEARAEAERRSSLENPQTPLSFPAEWLLDIWQGGRTDSGIRVSEMTALQVSTVFACVQLIANAVAGLDLNVYERYVTEKNERAGKRLAFDHNLFDLLQNEPNDEMTSFTFRKTLQCHALLWGNLYAEIERDGGGRVIALWPRNPARCKPYRTASGLLVYKTSEGMDQLTTPGEDDKNEGPQRTIFAENMIHVPGLAIDARLGQSVSWLSRQVLGLALATEKFGGKLFANGARPGGILVHPGKLSDKARATLKQSWQEAQGGENAHRVAVLEEGLKYEKLAATPEEAQFLGTREYQRVEICGIFGVPPHMIGDSSKSNRANTEQLGLEFGTYALNPHLKAWTQELTRKLFPKVGRAAGRFFPMFDTRPLVLPDAAARKDFYGTGKQWGYLCTNDILEMEHLNPTEQPGADLYWMPVNMQVMSDDPPPQPGQDPSSGDPKDNKLGQRLVRAYSRLFLDAFRRINARRHADSEAYRRAFMPAVLTLAEAIEQLASGEFGLEPSAELEESRFLAELVDGLRIRVQNSPNSRGAEEQVAEEQVARELPRIVKAISIEVFRSLATRRAKAQTEDA
jgi:HK97 family phage portal protein